MALVLNEYCKSVSKKVFIKTKQDSSLTPKQEALKDTRLAMFSESGADNELNDDVLKMASGDDPIRVNPKYQKEYEFTSYAKLLIATNHKPKINVGDAAMVRRVKFTPFMTKFVSNPSAPNERHADMQLVTRMKTELLNLFFTWVLDGAIKWYKNGLPDKLPAVMQSETECYINECDDIGEFLLDEIEEGVGDSIFIYSNAMYQMYMDWSRAQKTTPKGI